MAVYVDNFYVTGVTFGRMKMSHLYADTHAELLEMVDAIGVDRRWIQHDGTANEHFDIALGKRKKAIELGAVEVNFRDYAKFIEARCATYGVAWTHSSITQIKLP